MKTLIAMFCLAVFTVAEPPPNSYLPPPPSSRGTGYPSGPVQNFASTPEIVAARTLGGSQGANGFSSHGAQANGFGRSGQDHRVQGRFNPREQAGYEPNAAFARNSVEDINAEPANYNFGYMVNDYQEGTDFAHHEQRLEERAQGQYHVVLPDGRKQTVNYEADERGFKPQVSYENTEDLDPSGYDHNAANARNGNHGNGFGNNGNHNIGNSLTHSNGYN